MRIQENSNKKSSFGMAFKFTRAAKKRLIEYEAWDEFKNDRSKLEEMAKDVYIVLIKGTLKDAVEFIATPINNWGVNNPITTLYYILRGKFGWSTSGLNKNIIQDNHFISETEVAINDLLKQMPKKK